MLRVHRPRRHSPKPLKASATYTGTQYVTLSDKTAGCSIYYALHGATPTASSTLYTGPIKVAGTETIKAIAVKKGYTSSAIASAKFSIE